MAEGGETPERAIKNAPTTLKADIWAHFGFYQQHGKPDLDKTHAVCKSCHAKIKYAGGNTTNMRNHVSRFHPELQTPVSAIVDPAQPKIDQLISTLPPNSVRGQRITRAVASFIAKDIRPFSVVENPGFRHLLTTLEPRYKLPSRSHFSEKVIPELYLETKAQVMASMSQAHRVAITWFLDFGRDRVVCDNNGTLH